jgi:hypothetical protein
MPQLAGHITEEAPMPAQTPIPARAQSLMQRWVERWDGNPHDARAVWLGAMLLVGDRVARSTSAELPEMVRQWLAAVVAQAREEADGNVRNDGAAQAIRRDDLIADARAWLQSHPRSPLDSLFGGGPPHPIRSGDSNLDPKVIDRHHADDETIDPSPDDAPIWKNPRPSNYAGFLFLIPLLTRTGVTNIVADDPGLIERDWTTALVLRLARRLGISSDDPAVMWAVTRPVTIARIDRSLTAEVFRAARIRLRMETGLTMREVVDRPGTIVATRTSIDVFLYPADVDSNLHRAGLGTESDFVPWLARALQFHYLNTNPIDVTA